MGIQIKLNKNISLQIENKLTLTYSDLIDGQCWQEQPYSTNGKIASSMTRNKDKVNYLSLGFNIHKK